jgi:uncharacterized membrane protein (DUF373 family)
VYERASRSAVERLHEVASSVDRWLHVGENLVLIGVAVVLLLAGLVVVVDAGRDLLDAIVAQSIAEAIFSIVENGLLALILAELVNTLLVSLRGGPLSAEPFLVIGIVGILRKMLLSSVTSPKPPNGDGVISPLLAELLGLGVLILLLSIALALTRFRAPREADRLGDGDLPD